MPGCTPCPYESPCYRYEDKGSPNQKTETSSDDKKGLKGVVSRELRAGVLYTGCDCIKRNGLQDDCQRSQCQGGAACLTKGGPTCPPGRLALQRVRDAPNAKIKRDPDHFKVRCDDKPGSESKTQPHSRSANGKHEAGECDVIIIMQTAGASQDQQPPKPSQGQQPPEASQGQQSPEAGRQPTKASSNVDAVCPACGMKLKSGEKGKICDQCTETATMGVLKRADGLSDDDRKNDQKGRVFLCFPRTSKREDDTKKT